jgi:hypothetical protein
VTKLAELAMRFDCSICSKKPDIRLVNMFFTQEREKIEALGQVFDIPWARQQ